MDFKDRVKARRLELGMTLDEVAKIVGVSNATISRWESGAIENQRRDKIEALAKALQIPPSELMGWEQHPAPTNVPAPGALTSDEARLVADYRRLAPEGKSAVRDFVDYAKTRYPLKKDTPSQAQVG